MKPSTMRNRRLPLHRCLLLVILSLLCSQASGLELSYLQGLLPKGEESVTVYGDDLMGDKVNPFNGALTFEHVDVSLPGNSALPVEFRRSHTPSQRRLQGQLGDWDLVVPSMSGTYERSAGWVNGSGQTSRCSAFGAPPPYTRYVAGGTGPALAAASMPDATVTAGSGDAVATPMAFGISTVSFQPWEYWNGAFLIIPGQGKQEVLKRHPSNTQTPADGATYPLVTKANWQIRCLSSLQHGSGEGFVAVSPEGVQYRFDRMTARPTTMGVRLSKEGAFLFVNDFFLVATQVTDRFGNWVRYSYSGDLPNPTRIESNDGRVLTIAYSSNRISSVSDGTRTWTYSYGSNNELTTVTLPNGRQWQFDLQPFLHTSLFPLGDGATCDNPGLYPDQTYVGTVTHPSGAVGTFTLRWYHHSRAYVDRWCIRASIQHGGADIGAVWPKSTVSQTLTQKKLSGPGLPADGLTWGFGYDSGLGLGSWSTCTASCGGTKQVFITAPDGTVTRKIFGTHFNVNEGILLQVDEGYSVANGTALRTTTYHYRDPAGMSWPEPIGTDINDNSDRTARYHRPEDRRIVSEQGSTFTWEAAAGSAGFDAYARVLRATDSNSLGYSRTEQLVYHDNTALWVLGQVAKKTETTSGLVEQENIYSATTALRTASKRNGLPEFTYGWYANGLLQWHADALSRNTTLSDYYRGVPRLITLPDGSIIHQALTNYGAISSITDTRGSLTSYGHDTIGRLNAVTYPAGDTVSWTNKAITYQYPTAIALGIPDGSLRVQSTQGRHQISTYHDALLRPVLTEDKDTATGKAVYTKMAYDYAGRVSFSSYPSSSSAATAGIKNTYDALGRLTQRQTTDGVTLEQIAYLSGNRKQITDADGHVTTISYQAFGEPSYERPTLIESPENQTTVINRDLFGKITSVTQSGTWSGGSVSATRSFTYDSHQRPCRRIDPESGSTIWGFDAASQISWELKGTSGTGCVTTQPAGATVFSYDALGRKTQDNDPGTADDVSYGYDAAGNLTNVTNPTATWTYTYNKRNLIETEQAALDGKIFTLNPAYDSLGHVTSLTTPGQTIAYAPDAWGRPTQLGSYASAIAYHPNGLPQSYTLGNGLSYSQTLDNRQRPQVQSTLDGGSVIQHYQYGYSDAGDLLSLSDTDEVDSLTLAYDDLHRLTSATGLWGSYGYVYDPLNNIRSRTGPNALTYSYNATTNRLSGISGSQSRSYGYNAKGEITGDGTRSFTLNAKGQIQTITGLATYGYDGNGKRIKTVKGGNTEYALYDQAGHLAYTEQGTTKTDFLNINGQTVVELKKIGSTTTATYLHPDLLGSPRKATDASGNIAWEEHYDPYGQKLNGVAEKIGYTGHAYDSESNLTYMEARFFDPLVGRFLSPDPADFSDIDPFSFGRYAYANNNPYRFTDPTGKWSWDNFGQGLVDGQTGAYADSAKLGTSNDYTIGAGIGLAITTGTLSSSMPTVAGEAASNSTAPIARYSRAAYQVNSKNAVATGIREAAEGTNCPKCGLEMKAGTSTAPQAQHEPSLSQFHYEGGGTNLSSADKKAYANSEKAYNGANCATCQRAEGGRQRQYVERKEKELSK